MNTYISIKTTPTGIPHIGCRQCGYGHPINQKHCKECGRASLFVHPEHLMCLKCGWPDD